MAAGVDGDRALAAWLAPARPVEEIGTRLELAPSQRHGFGLSGYEVLSVLAGRRGWSALSDLCAAIALSQPRISRLVSQLEQDGHLERTRDEHDGRAFRCRLTRKGRRVHAAAGQAVGQILGEASREPNAVAVLLRVELAARV